MVMDFVGKVGTDVLKTSMEIAKDFRIVMRPYSVRFLGYHKLRRLFILVSFCSKFLL